jgi:hypothetical protein
VERYSKMVDEERWGYWPCPTCFLLKRKVRLHYCTTDCPDFLKWDAWQSDDLVPF